MGNSRMTNTDIFPLAVKTHTRQHTPSKTSNSSLLLLLFAVLHFECHSLIEPAFTILQPPSSASQRLLLLQLPTITSQSKQQPTNHEAQNVSKSLVAKLVPLQVGHEREQPWNRFGRSGSFGSGESSFTSSHAANRRQNRSPDLS